MLIWLNAKRLNTIGYNIWYFNIITTITLIQNQNEEKRGSSYLKRLINWFKWNHQ